MEAHEVTSKSNIKNSLYINPHTKHGFDKKLNDSMELHRTAKFRVTCDNTKQSFPTLTFFSQQP